MEIVCQGITFLVEDTSTNARLRLLYTPVYEKEGQKVSFDQIKVLYSYYVFMVLYEQDGKIKLLSFDQAKKALLRVVSLMTQEIEACGTSSQGCSNA